jgi:hypothetical protein
MPTAATWRKRQFVGSGQGCGQLSRGGTVVGLLHRVTYCGACAALCTRFCQQHQQCQYGTTSATALAYHTAAQRQRIHHTAARLSLSIAHHDHVRA